MVCLNFNVQNIRSFKDLNKDSVFKKYMYSVSRKGVDR